MALSSVLVAVGVVFADAPDPVANAAAVRSGEVQTVNGVQVVRISISGKWQWPTHKSDCNTNRTGAGYAIDWNDPSAPGFPVTTLNGQAIDVGNAANAYNAADNEVHPTRPEAAGSQFSDPGNPGSYASWKSGCGTYNGTMPTGVWGAVDLATGNPVTCTSDNAPSPTCLGGSHVYKVSDLEQGLNICQLTYDVHGKDSNVGGSPNGAKEITAGGSGHNGDNSAEKNGSTPVGNLCAPIHIPPPPTPTPTSTPTPTPVRTPTPTPNIACPTGTNSFVVNGTTSNTYSSGLFTVTVTFRNSGHVMDFSSNRPVRRVMENGPHGLNTYNFSPGITSGSNFQEPQGGLINKSVFCWVPPTATPTPTPTPVRTPTPTPCNCPTPTPPPTPCNCGNGGNPGTVLVQDFYGRTTTGTWTRADIGGPYTTQGPLGNFNVNGGSGAITVPGAGLTRSALLNQPNAQNVDIKFKVNVDKIAQGGNYYVYAVARRNGNNEYRPRLIFRPGGAIQVQASILVNGSESPLGPAVTVGNISQCACQWIWFHAQVYGTTPTTVRVKAWKDGTSEPTNWQFVETDSHSVCQTSGSLGLRVYTSPGVTNAPVTFRFDNYVVTSL